MLALANRGLWSDCGKHRKKLSWESFGYGFLKGFEIRIFVTFANKQIKRIMRKLTENNNSFFFFKVTTNISGELLYKKVIVTFLSSIFFFSFFHNKEMWFSLKRKKKKSDEVKITSLHSFRWSTWRRKVPRCRSEKQNKQNQRQKRERNSSHVQHVHGKIWNKLQDSLAQCYCFVLLVAASDFVIKKSH